MLGDSASSYGVCSIVLPIMLRSCADADVRAVPLTAASHGSHGPTTDPGPVCAAEMPHLGAREGTRGSLRIGPHLPEPYTVLAGVVSINGGVGVGKSTVLDICTQRSSHVTTAFRGRRVYIIEEPVAPQVSHPGYDWSALLQKMYTAAAARRGGEGGRYSFAAIFQMCVARRYTRVWCL